MVAALSRPVSISSSCSAPDAIGAHGFLPMRSRGPGRFDDPCGRGVNHRRHARFGQKAFRFAPRRAEADMVGLVDFSRQILPDPLPGATRMRAPARICDTFPL